MTQQTHVDESYLINPDELDNKSELVPIKIRLHEDDLNDLREFSDENGISVAEMCRRLLERRFALHLMKVHYVYPDDGVQIKTQLAQIFTELEKIRIEINRIGVNYNQDVRLRNSQIKNGKKPDWNSSIKTSDLVNIEDSFNDLADRIGESLWSLK